MTRAVERSSSKVPEVTLVFWIIKIAATTLGETGGDTVSMTLNGVTSSARTFSFVARRLGRCSDSREEIPSVPVLGDDHRLDHRRNHHGGLRRPLARHRLCRRLSMLFCLPDGHARRLVLVGRLDFGRDRQHAESGDVLLAHHHLLADARNGARRLDGRRYGLGYDGGALLFAAGLAVLAAAYFWTDISRAFLFWAAFILTRPLGATVGDFLDKPVNDGGLALSRPIASAVIAVFIVACILLLPQRAGEHPRRSETAT